MASADAGFALCNHGDGDRVLVVASGPSVWCLIPQPTDVVVLRSPPSVIEALPDDKVYDIDESFNPQGELATKASFLRKFKHKQAPSQ